MKNVYIDIGTNIFQGYSELKGKLGITDEWSKIFVEPNPDWFKTKEYQNYLNEPNSTFINKALVCSVDRPENIEFLQEKNRPMCQGSTITRPDFKNTGNYDCYYVPTVSFNEIIKNNLNDNWYIKMDCEGCEYSCLPLIMYHFSKNIKLVIVEFHSLGDPKEKELKILENQILEKAKYYGVPIELWK